MTDKIPENGTLLRIFIGDSDEYAGRPLYEAIVRAARDRGLAGATVFKGIMGFGKNSRLKVAKFVEISPDLPVVIEIIDSQDKIEAFVPLLDDMVSCGLVTLESVQIIKYVARKDAATPE